VVEEDLLAALESGQLSHAYLDVFIHEPLSETDPFWSHPQVSVTPHIASITNPSSVAPQIVENYYRIRNDLVPNNIVDRKIGY
jgi:glyoxylate/hydroxypyruvate reductase A